MYDDEFMTTTIIRQIIDTVNWYIKNSSRIWALHGPKSVAGRAIEVQQQEDLQACPYDEFHRRRRFPGVKIFLEAVPWELVRQ